MRSAGILSIVEWEPTQRVSAEEIEAAKTPAGGFTREQLALWGVPWPPPKGWKAKVTNHTA